MNRLNTVHYRDVGSNHIGWLEPDTTSEYSCPGPLNGESTREEKESGVI